jgi:phenylpropionate dioxygenase-like ring-hydroxylating dioxygenase large terminal subunit
MGEDAAIEASSVGIPSYRHATGWYCVGWADELAVGEVRRLQYFGRELVCFRGESGRPYVLDAHCLHLGAHLGVGGRVEGDRIACPWHGWRWEGDGRQALIPYSRQRCKPHLRLYSWPLREWYGMLLVWHDRHRRPPHWEPPPIPEADGDAFYPFHPHSRMLHRVRVHPQMIIENAADPYHVPTIHHGSATETTSFGTEGHRLHATIRTVYGEGRASTWMTPHGPLEATVRYDSYALGLGFVRFPKEAIESVQVTSHTPVDEQYTDYWFMQSSVREPGDAGDVPQGRAAKFLALQQQVVQQDFVVWEHMRYLERPNFAPEEAQDYVALRRWAQQFYPPEQPEPS